MSYTRGPGVQHWHSIDTLSYGLDPTLAGYQAWPSANLAIYCPLFVRTRVVVTKLWYADATVATGNFDIGLYDASGAALIRKGSAAKTGGGAEYVWDCTDTTIGPGLYWIALAISNNTDTIAAWAVTAPAPLAMGLLTEASAVPLPATATFAAGQTLALVPMIGMFLDTRVS